MKNVIQKGYARKVTEEEAVRRSQRTWYLPHRSVFHPQKQGKICVVFDAASLHDGVSLNNQLLQGPDLTRGTQREYSSKPLKHSIVKRILVFKR